MEDTGKALARRLDVGGRGSHEQRAALPPLDPEDRFRREVGHRKEDEGAWNSWPAQVFGPSMLMSGEAALRLRPPLTVQEEDRLNAARQEKVYTGQTLAPPEYVENVRKLRDAFDARGMRVGAQRLLAHSPAQSFDRDQLFKAVLSCGVPSALAGPGDCAEDERIAEAARQTRLVESLFRESPHQRTGSDGTAEDQEECEQKERVLSDGPTEQKAEEPLNARLAPGDPEPAANGAVATSGEEGSLSSLIHGHCARMAAARAGHPCNTLRRNLEAEASLDEACVGAGPDEDEWPAKAHMHVAPEHEESMHEASSVQEAQGSVPGDTAGKLETHASTRAGLESSCAANAEGVDVPQARPRNQTASVSPRQAFALLNARARKAISDRPHVTDDAQACLRGKTHAPGNASLGQGSAASGWPSRQRMHEEEGAGQGHGPLNDSGRRSDADAVVRIIPGSHAVNSVNNVNHSVDIEDWVAQRYADECAPCYQPATRHDRAESTAQHQAARAPTQPQLSTMGVQGSFEQCHPAQPQHPPQAEEHFRASEMTCDKAQPCHSRAPAQPQCSSPTGAMHAATSQHDAGAVAGDVDKADETARRKRALHTIMNADSSWSRGATVTAPVARVRDPLDGYPGKSVILAMQRRDLESLVAKFPSILPHRHAHVSRYSPSHSAMYQPYDERPVIARTDTRLAHSTSTETLRTGALRLLQDKVQRILETPETKRARPEEPVRGMREWTGPGLKKGEPCHGEAEGLASAPPQHVDSHVQLEPDSHTALFNMDRPSAQSAKRARAALQQAWWND